MSDPIQLESDVMGQVLRQVGAGELPIKRAFALVQSVHGQWYVLGTQLDKLNAEDAIVAVGLTKQWLMAEPWR